MTAVRRIVIAAATFLALALSPARATVPELSGGSPAPTSDPLATLKNNMVSVCPATGGHNCWKKISGPNQGGLNAAYTSKFPDATACTNYEGVDITGCIAGTGKGTFQNAAAVRQIVGNVGNNDTGFSAQMVDIKHRVLHFTGGGHPSHPPDDPILRFDLNAAAASINAGGPGGTWKVALNADAGRLIKCAGTNAAPIVAIPCTDNGWRPSWSNQAGHNYPGNSGNYWESINNAGYPMPIPGHTYYTGVMIGDVWTYASFGSGYPTSTLIGSVFGYDEAAQHPVGPFTIPTTPPLVAPLCIGSTSLRCSTDSGYYFGGSTVTNPAVNPQNNLPYVMSDSTGMVYFTDPVGPNIAGHNSGVTPVSNIRVNESKKPANTVFIPDPFHAGKECLIQVWKTNAYFSSSTGVWSGACNIANDNSTTPVAMIQSFQNPLPITLQYVGGNTALPFPMECATSTGGPLPCYTSVYQSYDPVSDVLWMTGAIITDSAPVGTPHAAWLYKIIRSSDPTKWNVVEVANQNSGGDVPYSTGIGLHLPVYETIQTAAGTLGIYTDNADAWAYNP